MSVLDLLLDDINEGAERAGKEKFKRLHTEPVEIVETPSGRVRRNLKTGEFTGRAKGND